MERASSGLRARIMTCVSASHRTWAKVVPHEPAPRTAAFTLRPPFPWLPGREAAQRHLLVPAHPAARPAPARPAAKPSPALAARGPRADHKGRPVALLRAARPAGW